MEAKKPNEVVPAKANVLIIATSNKSKVLTAEETMELIEKKNKTKYVEKTIEIKTMEKEYDAGENVVENDSSTTTFIIIGVVVGVILLIVLIILVGRFGMRRSRDQSKDPKNNLSFIVNERNGTTDSTDGQMFEMQPGLKSSPSATKAPEKAPLIALKDAKLEALAWYHGLSGQFAIDQELTENGDYLAYTHKKKGLVLAVKTRRGVSHLNVSNSKPGQFKAMFTGLDLQVFESLEAVVEQCKKHTILDEYGIPCKFINAVGE